MSGRGIFTENSGIVYHTTKSFCILGLRLRIKVSKGIPVTGLGGP
jgi:hypothetical protein